MGFIEKLFLRLIAKRNRSFVRCIYCGTVRHRSEMFETEYAIFCNEQEYIDHYASYY